MPAKPVSSRFRESHQIGEKQLRKTFGIDLWPLHTEENLCLWCRCFSRPGWEEGSRLTKLKTFFWAHKSYKQ